MRRTLGYPLLALSAGAATVFAFAPYRLFLLMPLLLALLLELVQRWPQRAQPGAGRPGTGNPPRGGRGCLPNRGCRSRRCP